MRTLRILAVSVALTAVAASLSAAPAAPIVECQAELAGVQSAIESAMFLGQNDAARGNLLRKYDDALAKLDAGKVEDAVGKLEDIRNTAEAYALAAKPKLNEDDAAAIEAAVDAAVACLRAA